MSNKNQNRRIAIIVGAGFVPGLNGVIKGAATAATQQGWEVVGIRDGFAGLLEPERYPDGGLVELGPRVVEHLDPASGCILGQSARVDPFNVRHVDENEMIEEVDRSDALLEKLKAENIDAVIAVVGGQGLSILYKLHLKGLKVVCIPRSIDNDIAPTTASFGFNTALGFTIEMVDRARLAAEAAHKIAVVEVQGAQVGWIALQAGIAAGADAILIPEIPGDLKIVAAKLREKICPARPYGLVVVAEGAQLVTAEKSGEQESPLKASLSPLAFGDNSTHVINRSGKAADTVAKGLQLQIAEETYPLVVGPWIRGGSPTAVDRQLGMAYGAGAIQALQAGKEGVMVAFNPPKTEFIPLVDAINKVRTVPADGMFMSLATSLGINFGK